MRLGCAAHCTTCDRCFSGDAAFDAHRVGSPNNRRCADPATLTRHGAAVLVEKTDRGVCSFSDPPRERVGTVVWQLAATAARFAA